MADIAMLVAEEYERRVKNSAKSGAHGEAIDVFSFVSGSSNWIKMNFGEEKMEQLKRVLEPKTQIGFAAINGFFSA